MRACLPLLRQLQKCVEALWRGPAANGNVRARVTLRVVAEDRARSRQLAREASAEEALPIPMETGLPGCNAKWCPL